MCTSVTDKDAEREHVTRALSSNSYPKAVVDWNRPPTSLPALPLHDQEVPRAVVTPLVYRTLVGINTSHPQPLGHPYLLPPPPDPQTDARAPEGSC